MRTREIPRTDWVAFFDNYSREHEGWPMTLEVFGPDIGDQIEERELALEGVTAELAEAGDKVEIMIGAAPDGHITHSITAPNQVSLEQTDEGRDLVLAIKGADGAMTLVRFLPMKLPFMPEAVAV